MKNIQTASSRSFIFREAHAYRMLAWRAPRNAPFYILHSSFYISGGGTVK